MRKPSVKSLRTLQDTIKHLSFKPCLKCIIKLRMSENEDDVGQDLCEHMRLWSFTEPQTIPALIFHSDIPVGNPGGQSLLPSAVLSRAY